MILHNNRDQCHTIYIIFVIPKKSILLKTIRFLLLLENKISFVVVFFSNRAHINTRFFRTFDNLCPPLPKSWNKIICAGVHWWWSIHLKCLKCVNFVGEMPIFRASVRIHNAESDTSINITTLKWWNHIDTICKLFIESCARFGLSYTDPSFHVSYCDELWNFGVGGGKVIWVIYALVYKMLTPSWDKEYVCGMTSFPHFYEYII